MSVLHRAGRPLHTFPVFPCGAFLKEKPRKIYFAGNVSPADGRAQRLFPGRVPGFLFWFSFLSPERKENKREHKQNESAPQGARFRRGAPPYGSVPLRSFSSFSSERSVW